MKIMIIATAALALSMGAAMAGEGNYDPFPNSAAGRFTVPAQVFNDTGSAGYFRGTRSIAGLANDSILPENGSQSAIQTVNSLPAGAEEGTVAYTQAMSVQRWVQAHQFAHTRTAAR